MAGANLARQGLSGKDFRGHDLRGANLAGADLCGADLSLADLSGANLVNADLQNANLSGAILSGASLNGADLRHACLAEARLAGAVLEDALLSHADLSGANLRGADLHHADLQAACHPTLRTKPAMTNQTLTAIPGLLVGHATRADPHTGCTAILCPQGFTPGLAVPGFAPGSRETELMRPESLVDCVHGIALSGGSAFGLAAADGIMRHLQQLGHGFTVPHGVVPIVPGAVIYDLDRNTSRGALPDAAMGQAAAAAASSDPVEQGAVGAGTGARCGRLFSCYAGRDASQKAGLGSALASHGGILVAALVVLNALGNVVDPQDGTFLAGGRDEHGAPLGQAAMLAALAGDALPPSNTVLTVVATNVPLNKAQTSRLARMAATGLARCLRPAHLTLDGDMVFALASQQPLPAQAGPWTENLLGALGAEAVARATVAAATTA